MGKGCQNSGKHKICTLFLDLMTESFLKCSYLPVSWKNQLENIIFKEMIRLIRIYVFRSCCSPAWSYNLICVHQIKRVLYIPSIPLLFLNIVLARNESLTRLSGVLKGSEEVEIKHDERKGMRLRIRQIQSSFPFTSLYGTIVIHLLSSCGLICLMERTNTPERGMRVFQH